MNRFAWDFRSDPPVQIPGRVLRRRAAARSAGGSRHLPGEAHGARAEPRAAPLKVIIDPRIQKQVTPRTCRSRLELAHKVQGGHRRAASRCQPDSRIAHQPADAREVDRRRLSQQRSHCRRQGPRPEDDAGRGEADPGEDEELGRQPALSQHAQRAVRQLQRPDPELSIRRPRRSSCWSTTTCTLA